MGYFMSNAMRVGIIVGSIAIFLLCSAFIFGSIVHDVRQRNFGMAFAELCIAFLGYTLVIRFVFIEPPIEMVRFIAG